MKPLPRFILPIALSLLAGVAQAQTVATDPWVRATVAGQQATGLFVELKSPDAARLTQVSSPAAASVEVHEMSMQDGVMRMRAVPRLELPAGQPVALKPGGYHVMLMGLKRALPAGEKVDVTLTIEHAGGKRETLTLQAPVRALGANPAAGH